MNTKSTGAIIHSELSVTRMYKFMASLEGPSAIARTLKKWKQEIGVTIEKDTKNSFPNATELEQNLCSLNSSAANEEGIVDWKLVMTWVAKRKGSGRAYNSKSGHGVLTGIESENILSYETRISNCEQCEVHKVTSQVKEHDCMINWGGSSEAMASDLAVEMLVSGTTQKARISTIVMDEDSTTMAKIKKICVT